MVLTSPTTTMTMVSYVEKVTTRTERRTVRGSGYYYDGQLMEKGHYKDGKKDGPWVSYHADGTVDEKDTGTYKNGVKVD